MEHQFLKKNVADEIEITPAMRKAGFQALWESSDSGVDLEYQAMEVFRAMLKASPQTK